MADNVVIRYNTMEGGQRESTNVSKTRGDTAPVEVVLSNGQKYSFGANQTHTLVEPYASEALAFDDRLEEVSRS